MDRYHLCFELLQSGDADGLRRLVDETPDAAEATDAAGVSLLMHALYCGRRDLAETIAGKKLIRGRMETEPGDNSSISF